jgi:two-component system, cell cycle sensor histidine kinase and response regulator CckA
MVASQATKLLVEEDCARAQAVERMALADGSPRGVPGGLDLERIVALDSVLIKDSVEYSVELRVSPACYNRGERARFVPVQRGLDGEGVEKNRLETMVMQAQRMESVGALASGLAHDLNSALAPILMGLHALQQRCADEESRRWLALMHKSAERGKDLVERVLAFARGAECECAPLQTTELIGDITRILKETLPENIELQARIPNDLWSVIGDATQIGQILMNLCINARDAMPAGGKLMIRARNRYLVEEERRLAPGAPQQRYVRITVADTGGGITREIIDRVFEPFFTTKEKGKGTGLGLSTVLAIVRGHGGFVSLFSKVGKGTEFKVYLPAQAPDVSD